MVQAWGLFKHQTQTLTMQNAFELTPSADILQSIETAKHLYDTKAVVQNDKVTDFFPRDASGNIEDANYVSVPFSGHQARHVIGIALHVLNGAIQSSDNVDPIRILNALRDAVLVITSDSDKRTLVEIPLAHIIGEANVVTHFDSLNNESVNTVIFESGFMHRLAQSFTIAAGQTFRTRIYWKNTTGLPTAANWTAAGAPGGLRLRLTFQVGE